VLGEPPERETLSFTAVLAPERNEETS